VNLGLWIARKNYLCTLVRKTSELFGGDDIEFLREHCRELIDTYFDERIEEAIRCYEAILESCKYRAMKTTIPDNKNGLTWELMPPFIPYTDELKEKCSGIQKCSGLQR